jgi:hypothetical protein
MSPVAETANAALRRPDHSVNWDADLSRIVEKISSVREPIGVYKDGDIVGLIDPYGLLDAISRMSPAD